METPSRTSETPRCMASLTRPSTLEFKTLQVSIHDLTGSSVPSSDDGAVLDLFFWCYCVAKPMIKMTIMQTNMVELSVCGMQKP